MLQTSHILEMSNQFWSGVVSLHTQHVCQLLKISEECVFIQITHLLERRVK